MNEKVNELLQRVERALTDLDEGLVDMAGYVGHLRDRVTIMAEHAQQHQQRGKIKQEMVMGQIKTGVPIPKIKHEGRRRYPELGLLEVDQCVEIIGVNAGDIAASRLRQWRNQGREFVVRSKYGDDGASVSAMIWRTA